VDGGVHVGPWYESAFRRGLKPATPKYPGPHAARVSSPLAEGEHDAVVRDIGRLVERMAQRTKDEDAYLPHPLAVAMAEAVRGGNLTDGDGSFAAQEAGYQVVMSKRHGHFALLEVMDLRSGRVLPAPVVRRLLQGHEVLSQYPGDAVDRARAAGVLSGLLGLDDASSEVLLGKAGLRGDAVDKRALLALVERMPA